MFRIDYETSGSRLMLDARDFITLLVALPTIIEVDKKSVSVIEKIMSSLIATSEELEDLNSPYLSVEEGDVIKIYKELKQKEIEAVKSLEKETKKNSKAVENDNKEWSAHMPNYVKIPAYAIPNLKKYNNTFLGSYDKELTAAEKEFVINYFKEFGFNVVIKVVHYVFKKDLGYFSTQKPYYSYTIFI